MPFNNTHPILKWLGVDPDGVIWWEVHEGFTYTTTKEFSVNIVSIDIPIGMHTDLASIPKRLRGWLDPAGPYMPAALVHDLLYARHRAGDETYTRKQVDTLLLLGMKELKVNWLTRQTVYYGVRIGGFVAWNRTPRFVGSVRIS